MFNRTHRQYLAYPNMAPPLFSQIPVQILNKVKGNDHSLGDSKKRRVTFHENSTDDDTDQDIDVDASDTIESSLNSDNQPESHRHKPPPSLSQNVSDAIIQVDLGPKCTERGTQTDESMLTRPLINDEYDKHRHLTQTHYPDIFKPMYSIPKRKNGSLPPLKLGLIMPKGKKRKVFYPHEEDRNGSYGP